MNYLFLLVFIFVLTGCNSLSVIRKGWQGPPMVSEIKPVGRSTLPDNPVPYYSHSHSDGVGNYEYYERGTRQRVDGTYYQNVRPYGYTNWYKSYQSPQPPVASTYDDPRGPRGSYIGRNINLLPPLR